MKNNVTKEEIRAHQDILRERLEALNDLKIDTQVIFSQYKKQTDELNILRDRINESIQYLIDANAYDLSLDKLLLNVDYLYKSEYRYLTRQLDEKYPFFNLYGYYPDSDTNTQYSIIRIHYQKTAKDVESALDSILSGINYPKLSTLSRMHVQDEYKDVTAWPINFASDTRYGSTTFYKNGVVYTISRSGVEVSEFAAEYDRFKTSYDSYSEDD